MKADLAYDFKFAELGHYGDAWETETARTLSVDEEREWQRFHAPRRRRAWLVARFLARRLLDREIGEAGTARPLEVLSRDDRGAAVRPLIRLAGQRMPWSLSITHSEQLVGVALARDENVQIGVDLVEATTLSQSFLQFWFTEAERRCLARSDRWTAAQFWAAKEAAYKAANRGEPFAPRKIVVSLADDDRLNCACHLGAARIDCHVLCRPLAKHYLAIALAPRSLRHVAGAGISVSPSFCGQQHD